MSEELKLEQCPFCKGDKIDENGDGSLCWMECVNCGATGGSADTSHDAAIKWNTRPSPLISVQACIEEWKNKDLLLIEVRIVSKVLDDIEAAMENNDV